MDTLYGTGDSPENTEFERGVVKILQDFIIIQPSNDGQDWPKSLTEAFQPVAEGLKQKVCANDPDMILGFLLLMTERQPYLEKTVIATIAGFCAANPVTSEPIKNVTKLFEGKLFRSDEDVQIAAARGLERLAEAGKIGSDTASRHIRTAIADMSAGNSSGTFIEVAKEIISNLRQVEMDNLKKRVSALFPCKITGNLRQP